MSNLREAIEASMTDIGLGWEERLDRSEERIRAAIAANIDDATLDAHETEAARLREQLEEDDANLAHCDEEIEKLRGALIGMVRQFGHWSDEAGGYMTGGLSALQDAFEALRWSDPRPEPEDRCEAPGCTKQRSSGMPTPDGYRWLCYEHYRLVEEATR